MYKRILSYSVAAVLMLVAVGAVHSNDAIDDMAKIKYSVKKMGDKWKVVNEQNQPRPIQAKSKDDIEWTAEGSEMVFQFPAELGPYLTKVEGEYDEENFTATVPAGKKLKLKVKNSTPDGQYTYSVYVKAGGTYAEGSSPPVIIISN